MYDNKSIVLHELIGLKVEVIRSNDHFQEGIAGIVVDESKNTLTVQTKSGKHKVIKKISIFKFIADKNSFTVNGKEINFRPYERTKKSMKYYHRRQLRPCFC
ncbi:ribonuclease P protein subunit [Candidatus Marsarchaeota archaeon]|nr:ribonuclease P protein subunit [Candidatus Marsarchaeota archaeon]MCL5090300.1 ribonuclease P protein subunit [Candidatus Marsarchaeota archaeon]